MILALTAYAELDGLAAHGDDHRISSMHGAILELDDLTVSIDPDLLDGLISPDLEPELARVPCHHVGQVTPGDGREAGIIFDEISLASDV